MSDRTVWKPWLVTDQRSYSDRPDVLTYVSEPLKAPLRMAGAPMVNLFASTSGTDSDWVVKLIDVYPDEVAAQPEMGGYQLPIAMDIFRGRYRQGFDKPAAITPNKAERYRSPAERRTTCSCRATASWCRSSPAGSRCTTATRRPSCRTSSWPSRAITTRRPSGCSTRA
jgi:hypothetical protein